MILERVPAFPNAKYEVLLETGRWDYIIHFSEGVGRAENCKFIALIYSN